MDAKELTDMINNHKGELPRPRFVVSVFAEVVAKLAPRLTQEELGELVALGALVQKRSSQLVPVYRLDDMPGGDVGRGWPVV